MSKNERKAKRVLSKAQLLRKINAVLPGLDLSELRITGIKFENGRRLNCPDGYEEGWGRDSQGNLVWMCIRMRRR